MLSWIQNPFHTSSFWNDLFLANIVGSAWNPYGDVLFPSPLQAAPPPALAWMVERVAVLREGQWSRAPLPSPLPPSIPALLPSGLLAALPPGTTHRRWCPREDPLPTSPAPFILCHCSPTCLWCGLPLLSSIPAWSRGCWPRASSLSSWAPHYYKQVSSGSHFPI